MTAPDRIWLGIHALAAAAGNTSKLLWGQGSAANERREPLRRLLKVPDESPLHNRTMRNHLEHLDERLERRARSSSRHNLVDVTIGPKTAIVGIDEGDFLRTFDPQTATVTFRGDSIPLQPIVEALLELERRANALLSQR